MGPHLLALMGSSLLAECTGPPEAQLALRDMQLHDGTEVRQGLRAQREVHTYSRSPSARRCRPGSRRPRRIASAPGCSACCCTGTAPPCTAGAAPLPLSLGKTSNRNISLSAWYTQNTILPLHKRRSILVLALWNIFMSTWPIGGNSTWSLQWHTYPSVWLKEWTFNKLKKTLNRTALKLDFKSLLRW